MTAEDAVGVFDSHLFRLGGVARRGIYDNMKTAVDKVKKGKGRVVNARFAVMCAHSLFDADFCNENDARCLDACGRRRIEQRVYTHPSSEICLGNLKGRLRAAALDLHVVRHRPLVCRKQEHGVPKTGMDPLALRIDNVRQATIRSLVEAEAPLAIAPSSMTLPFTPLFRS